MNEAYLFTKNDLLQYVKSFFIHLGVPENEAEISSNVLISADLRGVQSHGIIRLHTYYGDRLRKKRINPISSIHSIKETPTTLTLDGGNSIGMVVAHHGMTRCIEKTRDMGLSVVAVRNSNHYGIAGYYAMMALPENMIGISLTNSQPLVAPTYGRSAILGTNPIAVAVPAKTHRPYVLDMATSIVPIGKVTVYNESGRSIPNGWGIDSSGQVTTNPRQVLEGGALLPLGGTDLLAGYKGYGLSLLVDILSGVLAGAATGLNVGQPQTATQGSNVGHFFMTLRIDAFRPLEDFLQDMDGLIDQLKQSPKAENQPRIYIHGEKEFERAERYEKEGIPILVETVESLVEAGQKMGLPFNLNSLGKGKTEAY